MRLLIPALLLTVALAMFTGAAQAQYPIEFDVMHYDWQEDGTMVTTHVGDFEQLSATTWRFRAAGASNWISGENGTTPDENGVYPYTRLVPSALPALNFGIFLAPGLGWIADGRAPWAPNKCPQTGKGDGTWLQLKP